MAAAYSALPFLWRALAAGAGLLLLAGFWTPVTGVLVAIIELWIAFARPGELSAPLLLGTLGIGLAMLGPGAWSIDARFWGRKRIEIRVR